MVPELPKVCSLRLHPVIEDCTADPCLFAVLDAQLCLFVDFSVEHIYSGLPVFKGLGTATTREYRKAAVYWKPSENAYNYVF